MFTCSQCQLEFETLKSKSTHENKCIDAHNKYGHINIEELKFLYYEEKYSLQDLSDYYSVGKGLRNYMKRLNLPLRNISESKTARSKDKQLFTNLTRYGQPHNFSKNHPSRVKWESTLLKNECISNVFLRSSVKEKIKETLISRYGVDHPMRSSEIVDKVMHARSLNPSKNFIRFFSIHKKVCDLLNELKIEYETEFYIKGKNKRCFYDIRIGNLLIEVNGNYWHANPVLYKAKDLLSFHGNIFTAEEIWKIDKEKAELATENGYKILYLWETDINTDFKKVKQIINERCKN